MGTGYPKYTVNLQKCSINSCSIMGFNTQNLQLTCKNLGTSEFGDSICDGDIQLYGWVYFFCLIINAPFHCFEQVIIFKNRRVGHCGGTGGHYYE